MLPLNIGVSIILPAFNAEKTIEKTILSVISSKTKDTEYIIIDGNSSDGTISIIHIIVNLLIIKLINFILIKIHQLLKPKCNKNIKI